MLIWYSLKVGDRYFWPSGKGIIPVSFVPDYRDGYFYGLCPADGQFVILVCKDGYAGEADDAGNGQLCNLS